MTNAPFNETELTLDVGDGVTLNGTLRRPSNEPIGQIICLPGLTRNKSDFSEIASILATEGYEVACISLRGRAQSSYTDYSTYHPVQYRDDVFAALDRLEWQSAVFLGTSLGGIVTMLCAEADASRIRAAIINDIGTELAVEGIARIMGYMASRPDQATTLTFDEAVSSIKDINRVAFPNVDDSFWEKMAKRTFRPISDGSWALDYDQNISRALAELGPAPDLTPGWKALGDTPTLLVRGAISDLLSPEIVGKMMEERPGFAYIEAANIGHAPMLDEFDVAPEIIAFLGENVARG
ncbi:MAG: alpha/beta hydrolase [Pseudomonadota bacterium]